MSIRPLGLVLFYMNFSILPLTLQGHSLPIDCASSGNTILFGHLLNKFNGLLTNKAELKIMCFHTEEITWSGQDDKAIFSVKCLIFKPQHLCKSNGLSISLILFISCDKPLD